MAMHLSIPKNKIINTNNSPTPFHYNFSAPDSCVCSITPMTPSSWTRVCKEEQRKHVFGGERRSCAIIIPRCSITYPISAGQCSVCDAMRSGMMGDRSRQLPRISLPNLVGLLILCMVQARLVGEGILGDMLRLHFGVGRQGWFASNLQRGAITSSGRGTPPRQCITDEL
jgi:hypothetical protein